MRLRIPRLLVHSSRRRALLGSRLRRGSETNCRGPRAAADSKLGGGSPPPDGAASRLRLSAGLPAGNAGCSSCLDVQWALGAWGPLPKPAVCRRWLCGGTRRFVPRGGARSGANCKLQVQHALRTTKASRGARRGSTTSHNITSNQTAYCNVQARVPTSPVTYNQPNYSNSKHLRPAPLAPKYWVFKGPYLRHQASKWGTERSCRTSMTSVIFMVG